MYKIVKIIKSFKRFFVLQLEAIQKWTIFKYINPVSKNFPSLEFVFPSPRISRTVETLIIIPHQSQF